MHFHMPKPLHGWRAFLGEVAIIVLGVLIALTAEQLVENWHWREQVRDGREAFAQDLVTILENADERQAEDKCIRDRLVNLRRFLDAKPGYIYALGHVGSPPSRSWYPASWDSLVASNVSVHLERKVLLEFGDLAHTARRAEDATQREIADWVIIYTMVGPARKLASGEEAQIRKAVTDAAFQLNLIRLISAQLRTRVMATKLLTSGDIATARTDLAETLKGPNAQRICGPILPADAARVDAPYDPTIQVTASRPAY